MGHQNVEGGFTVAEVVVTLVLFGIFVGVFLQMYMTSLAQRTNTILQAAANDVAQTNLRKATKSAFPSTANCDSTHTGSSNLNNGASGFNPALNPSGSPVVDPLSGSSIWGASGANPQPESASVLATLGLPASTTQTLLVMYPNGCNTSMPAKIISIVQYGSSNSTKVVHEAYIN